MILVPKGQGSAGGANCAAIVLCAEDNIIMNFDDDETLSPRMDVSVLSHVPDVHKSPLSNPEGGKVDVYTVR